MDEKGLKHLIRVLGLCQTPRDSWSEDDNRALREAREYVQTKRKDISEGKHKETGSGDVGEGPKEQDALPPEDGVREEGVLVEEGGEGTHEPDG